MTSARATASRSSPRTPDRPAEVEALEGGALRPLSRQNDAWLAEVELGVTEEIRFKAADGTEIHGLMVKPPGFQEGRRYPTLLRIHGGPVAQYQREFSFEWQLFAAHGYVVVGANPRGSSGRGEAFQRAVFNDWGTSTSATCWRRSTTWLRQGSPTPNGSASAAGATGRC